MSQIFRTKSIFHRVIPIIISLIIIAALLKNLNFNKIEISRIYYWPILIVVVSMIAAYILRSYIYRIILLKEQYISLAILFKITSIYNFLSALFPFGFGHLSYPYFVKKYCKVSFSSSLNSLFLYNLVRVVLLLLLMLYSAANVLKVNAILPTIVNYGHRLIVLTGLLVISFIVGLIVLRKRDFKNETNLLAKITGSLSSIVKYNLKRLPIITILSVIVIIFNIFYVYFLYRTFGIKLPFISVYFLLSLNNLSTLLPVSTASSIGSFEIVNSLGMVLIGFDLNQAIQISFAVHILGLILQALMALICFYKIEKMNIS